VVWFVWWEILAVFLCRHGGLASTDRSHWSFSFSSFVLYSILCICDISVSMGFCVILALSVFLLI
jgi:hypothetical protein